ncbi:MAG: hypothetical protein K0S32_1753 [Bacteroidetes bacterium]|jgi:uncharacterized RDD family membrane protein YckC|nr:hypothetical protein [Bacteroidota bacterium]
MHKITEIRETYKAQRKEKVDGVDTMVEKELVRFKPVNYVSGWARFGHFLLDKIFVTIFGLMIGLVIGFVVVILGGTVSLDPDTVRIYDSLLNWFLIRPLFYFIFEATMQATPAKAILKRVVVDEYGNKPTVKQIFIRSISRAVPFEGFSCLSETGWHDDWSKTFVIRKKDLEELRLIQKIQNIQEQEITPEAEQRQ